MNYCPATLRNLLLLLQIYKRLLIQLCSQFDHKHQDCRRYRGRGAELSFHVKIHNPSVAPSASAPQVFACLVLEAANTSQTRADNNLVQEGGEVEFS